MKRSQRVRARARPSLADDQLIEQLTFSDEPQLPSDTASGALATTTLVQKPVRKQSSAARAAAFRNAKDQFARADEGGADLSNANGLMGRGKNRGSGTPSRYDGGTGKTFKRFSKKNKRGTA